ncbi:MAG: ABC transporter permease [Fimbriimonadaceae bacterium]|jgi:ABC-type polysaccharide/polyol phosphate export permease|nr:ABC transporter permease [Fimbriimonadaceae bacterium]
MLSELKELWRFRELLLAMVERELRIRYKNSALGVLWSLLNPLLTVVVMWFVLKTVMQNNTDNISAYILAGYLPFLFFQMAILDSAQSVLAALPVVKKVYFPREILPLASVISNLIHFVLALAVYLIYALILWGVTGFKDFPVKYNVLFLPVLLLVHVCLVGGVSFIVSALNVFYEDVKYVVSVLMYLMFFLTPVMYFSETVFYAMKKWGAAQELGFFLYHLNPVATLITAYRKTLVAPGKIQVLDDGVATQVSPLAFNWLHFGIAVVFSVAILILGYSLFNKLKWRFVERP